MDTNRGQEEKEAQDNPLVSPFKPPSLIKTEEVEIVDATAAPSGQEVQSRLNDNQLVDSSEGDGKEGLKRTNMKGKKKIK